MAGFRKLRVEGRWKWGEKMRLAGTRVSVETSLHKPRANMLTDVQILPMNESTASGCSGLLRAKYGRWKIRCEGSNFQDNKQTR